ncbi:probable leucine-rich repeat receptor-like serine/threonine-protein kinase At3g14840 isoform X2 [Punica granatum]|uniref:non-specific serine/threonine protein kinase n=2 Tax=Punica granatum TaxID=22663 RepID=A0A6P8EN52_PUNGR|nr:probable leucine-rich repeat receptor-like serine/threonine-protein kinase At3g14840 isoform X2 [Punica granatum]
MIAEHVVYVSFLWNSLLRLSTSFCLLISQLFSSRLIRKSMESALLRMFHCQLVFTYILFFCLKTSGSYGATLPKDEVKALRDIAATLGKKGWNFTGVPCSRQSPWITAKENNVTCDCSFSDHSVCHVVSIILQEQSLPGTLPSQLIRLPYLKIIDLQRNYLSGRIPPTWGSMAYLQTITLSGNRLTGPIPKEIGNISTLVELQLEDNQLSGVLPLELGNLSQLRRLLLTSNNFTGQLPETFVNLIALLDVWLGDNRFTGKVPDFIRNWLHLERLFIQASGFEGPICEGIGVLQNLSDLRITDLNGLAEARFPKLNSRKFKKLILRSCNFIGPLPPYLGEMSILRVLDLSFNKLVGEIPRSYRNLPELEYMYLTGNQLNGSISDWVTENNVHADLSYNNFNAEGHQCQEGPVNLFANSPESRANKSKMISCLEACHGQRQHSIFINCGGKELTIGSTKYDDDIVSVTSASFDRDLSHNWAISSTGNFLDFDGIPIYIAQNTSRLSMDNSVLYMSARISPISLTYYGFYLTNGTYNVSLYFAEIVFTGDRNYSSLGRRYFDVYIQGKMVLKDFNIEDEAGGAGKLTIKSFNANVTGGTLEIRLHWAGRGTVATPERGVYGPLISAISAVNRDYKEPRHGSRLSVAVVSEVVAGITAFIFLVIGILWRSRRPGPLYTSERELQNGSFTLRHIKAATNNFSAANKIGEGGFGCVYKGLLSDGTAIAVKQLSNNSNQGNREFMNEIAMISALQHPHLVKLYGCCIERDQLLLVYEYLENNNLARALFGPEEFQLNLDWWTRHMICVGIARGLAFLHEESRLKIVHRDIKATNILLDENLNPKISDFGLAKLFEDDNTHISTRIAGTFGYMAPEYAMYGYLTDKADIYSFGIVALEIVAGRGNSSYRHKGGCLYLLDWAHVLNARGTLMDLMDRRLGSDFDKDQVMVMIRVALLCTSVSPLVRPAMSSVVRMLEGDEEAPEITPDIRFSLCEEDKIEAMRKHFMGCEGEGEPSKVNAESHNTEVPAASSASVKDLYPIFWNTDTRQNSD